MLELPYLSGLGRGGETADAVDSKSTVGNHMGVQVPPSAPSNLQSTPSNHTGPGLDRKRRAEGFSLNRRGAIASKVLRSKVEESASGIEPTKCDVHQ